MTKNPFLLARKAAERITDAVAVRFGPRLGIAPGRLGFGGGRLVRERERAHRSLDRPVRICLLTGAPGGGPFGRFVAYWLNERSRACAASLDEGIEAADVVWVYARDPIPEETRRRLLQALGRARPGAPVLNHPDVFNAYHAPDSFRRLAEAGVSVPRFEFTGADVGRTRVVYKRIGFQPAPKFLSLYAGERPGWQAFEFQDARDAGGIYWKFRAYFLAGAVWPSNAMLSRGWHVRPAGRLRMEYSFQAPSALAEQIRRVASALGLRFFAADYLVPRAGSGPVVIDVNANPNVVAFRETVRSFGGFGRFHVFDVRARLGLPEPLGRSPWEALDEAMVALARGGPA